MIPVLTLDSVNDEVIWSLSPGEIVLLVTGCVLTLGLIGLFIFILRMAFKEERSNKQ